MKKFRQILYKNDIKTVFKRGLTIKNVLKPIKSNALAKSNVVYKINCNDCDAVYVGTTKRKLSSRIQEHKNALVRPTIQSNIADHSFHTKHNINFNDPQISYIENKSSARYFLENFEIARHKISKTPLMNDQQNCNSSIPKIYLSLLK